MSHVENRMRRADHFKLGTFSTNCSSGMSVTRIPERWDASWDSNLALAKLLDELMVATLASLPLTPRSCVNHHQYHQNQ